MHKKLSFMFLGACAAFLFSASTAFAAQGDRLGARQSEKPSPSITLPGGATTMQETFADWIVTCGVANDARICAASQQLVQKNGQRVLAVEIKPEGKDTRVDVVLPFGILVSEGITYQVGTDKAARKAAIRTCFPGGCVSTFKLDQSGLQAFRAAKDIRIGAQIADSEQKFDLAVSLDGFASAYDRLNQLLK